MLYTAKIGVTGAIKLFEITKEVFHLKDPRSYDMAAVFLFWGTPEKDA